MAERGAPARAQDGSPEHGFAAGLAAEQRDHAALQLLPSSAAQLPDQRRLGHARLESLLMRYDTALHDGELTQRPGYVLSHASSLTSPADSEANLRRLIVFCPQRLPGCARREGDQGVKAARRVGREGG